MKKTARKLILARHTVRDLAVIELDAVGGGTDTKTPPPPLPPGGSVCGVTLPIKGF